jgi:hypothetical protein
LPDGPADLNFVWNRLSSAPENYFFFLAAFLATFLATFFAAFFAGFLAAIVFLLD